MQFHTGTTINAVDDANLPGSVDLYANNVKFGAIGTDGKLYILGVTGLGTGLTLDPNGRVVIVQA